MFPGISETVLSAIFGIPGLKGIVLETYGSGMHLLRIGSWLLLVKQ
jgi:L-asparaginase/Glu-tRNA(Gln) amidotransferase subunit D